MAAGQEEYHSYFPQELTPASLGGSSGALWHTEKLNPSRVSWVCPEVSSPLAIQGAQEQPVSVSKTNLSVEKTHFSCLALLSLLLRSYIQVERKDQQPDKCITNENIGIWEKLNSVKWPWTTTCTKSMKERVYANINANIFNIFEAHTLPMKGKNARQT